MARGIKNLHDHNIIHLDIKPDNILWTGERFIVIDFGISQNMEDTIIMCTENYTAKYCSPE